MIYAKINYSLNGENMFFITKIFYFKIHSFVMFKTYLISAMKHLPNILTLSNLFCGSMACILLIESENNLLLSIVLVCLSLIFDFFDGFVARLTKSNGEFGKQLDSLADMVTFGLFPGIIMMLMLKTPIYNYFPGHSDEMTALFFSDFLKYTGLLITLFSALRLAKFNIDTDQAYYFKGLPTPANTIFITSLIYIKQKYNFDLLSNIWILLSITLLSSCLLVANLPLLALKFKNFKWKDNSLVFSFLLICVILIAVLKVTAIPFIILIYIILSIIFRKKITSHGTKTT